MSEHESLDDADALLDATFGPSPSPAAPGSPPPEPPPPAAVLVEACVDTPESALAARDGGAARLELCDDLVEGGTTPSAGMISVVCARAGLPVVVLVRPRGGDFLYSADEREVMRRDIEAAKALGASAVALGALTTDGEIDGDTLRPLIEAARPMQVVFHRAFDLVPDPLRALEDLIALGVDRVLTSGCAPSAADGVETLARLVERAGDRIAVVAGGGITADNVARVVRDGGVREVHLRGAEWTPSAMRRARPDIAFGKAHTPDDSGRRVTSAERIRRVVRACAGDG